MMAKLKKKKTLTKTKEVDKQNDVGKNFFFFNFILSQDVKSLEKAK